MLSSAKLSGQFQRRLMKAQFKLDSRKLTELRKVATEIGDQTMKFWGKKLGREAMGKTQLEKLLQQLAAASGTKTLKNIKSQIDSYLKEEKNKEKTRQAREVEEKKKAQAILLRRYERAKETRENIYEELGRIEAESFKEGGKIVNKLQNLTDQNINQANNKDNKDRKLSSPPPNPLIQSSSVNPPPDLPLD